MLAWRGASRPWCCCWLTVRLRARIDDCVRNFRGNFIAIFPGRTSLQAGGTKAGAEVKLSVQDLDFLRAEVPFIKRLSPEVNKQSLVAYGTRSASYDVRGTYASYQKIRHVDVAEGSSSRTGRLYSQSRAVLGYDVKKKLFSGQNAIGENVRIEGVSYVIVGVMKHMISNGDDNMNAMIYVPFSSMGVLKKYLLSGRHHHRV